MNKNITLEQEGHMASDSFDHLFVTPVSKTLKLGVVWLFFISLLVLGFWRTGFFNFSQIAIGVTKLFSVAGFMFPPAHNGWIGDFAYGILETMSMAFLGTLAATILSIPLGFAGAKNIIPNKIFHFGFRRIFDGVRGVDSLIWALIFINVVGLGPFAGILAITVADTGVLSKLFSEAIENIDSKQVEGVKASGASSTQTIRYAIIPQIFPVIISNALYYFESNIRSATILGIVGAGGIGLLLSDRIRINNWDEASFIIIMILITVMVIDTISKEIRIRIIGNNQRVNT